MSKKKDNAIKEISINTLDKIYDCRKRELTKEFETGLPVGDGTSSTVKISVKSIIGFNESNQFVNDVCNEIFQNGKYYSGIKDFSFKFYILQYFTNLRLKKNADENHEIIYNTDLYDELVKLIDKKQYAELVESVNEQIDFRKQSLIADKRNYSEIEQLIITILNKTSAAIDRLDLPSVMKVINELNTNGEKITEKGVVNTFLDKLYPKTDNVVSIKSDDLKNLDDSKETATTINE